MSEQLAETGPGPQGPVDFEAGDVAPGAIVRFGVVLLVVTLVVAVALYFLMMALRRHQVAGDPPVSPMAMTGDRQPLPPRLQTTPVQDLAAVREQEHELLTSYGWVDRGAGRVHVPITEAMRTFVQSYAAGGPALTVSVAPGLDHAPATAGPGGRR